MKQWLLYSICLFLPLGVMAQPKWKKSEPATRVDKIIFHSTMTANLPTTGMLKKGDWEYEISHRFSGPVNNGIDNLWGVDGPANIRFGLSYAPSNRLLIRMGRSNLGDNWDLALKYKLLQANLAVLPLALAVRGGVAWNSQQIGGLDRNRTDARNFQYFGQLIFNTLVTEGFAVGIVPSYLYNSHIFCVDNEYTFTLGNYYQYYFSRAYSLWLEYNPIVSGYQGAISPGGTDKSYNSLSFGMDIETGGHFFRLVLTNNTRLNTAQYLVGGVRSVSDNEWSLGFNITRYL